MSEDVRVRISVGDRVYWPDVTFKRDCVVERVVFPTNYLSIKVSYINEETEDWLGEKAEAIIEGPAFTHSYNIERLNGRWYCRYYEAWLYWYDGSYYMIIPVE